MNIPLLLIAGIAGTIIMTAFAELITFTVKCPYHMVGMSARMFEFKNSTSKNPTATCYFLAILLHCAVGIGCAYGYHVLISFDFLTLAIADVLLYGLLIGVIAIFCWKVFFVFFERNEQSPKVYLFTILVSYLVLAITMFQVFVLFGVWEQTTYPDVRWINSYGRSQNFLF